VSHFLDTNVLLYAVSTDPREARKRDQAVALLDLQDGALSVQVLQEFYHQATRPTREHALTHTQAARLIESWCRFEVQDMTLALVRSALAIKERHGFSYWDSAIIAAARALGTGTLYSEDMSHGRVVEGVTIVNPFL